MGYNHWDDIFKKLQLGEEVVVSPHFSKETIRTTLSKRISVYKKQLASAGSPVPHVRLSINMLPTKAYVVKMTEVEVFLGNNGDGNDLQ